MELIKLNSVSKHFVMGQELIKAVDEIDLQISKNEYVAFIGPSGSGKSSIMNILGCLDTPSSGQYFLNTQDVSGMTQNQLAEIRNKEIGFIFQNFNLLPRATALQNVIQPLIYRGLGLKARKEAAIAVLERVGLGDRMQHLPSELSGGQRQRVAIARALVTRPSILLADEPTGNLDSQTTRDIMRLFDELYDEGQTIIVVTHENDIAAHCRRIIRLLDGRIAEDQPSGRAAVTH
ncbi:MAG: macrolide ABC transporter ATP-binding protein [Gammaproteobacteria bacterium RIFCSPLOWO2_02_FULL_56_15]|nr:MAG: macrolide ABC transporter ATP-binding protein [Gammaproteobacteria bacterium RIFCSPLOWO2_02_FULL_56_15]